MVPRSIALSTMVGLLMMQSRLFNKDKLGSDTAKYQELPTEGGACLRACMCV